jgi:hypothetical protein
MDVPSHYEFYQTKIVMEIMNWKYVIIYNIFVKLSLKANIFIKYYIFE